jgi:hypothetical protein
VTRVLESVPRALEDLPDLRIHDGRVLRTHAEEARVEVLHAVEDRLGLHEVRVLEQGSAHPRRLEDRVFEPRDALTPLAEVPPERVDVVGAREAPRHADDRDGPSGIRGSVTASTLPWNDARPGPPPHGRTIESLLCRRLFLSAPRCSARPRTVEKRNRSVSGIRRSSSVCSRDWTWTASNEWPPASKKFSSMLRFCTPSSSTQMAAMRRSSSLRGVAAGAAGRHPRSCRGRLREGLPVDLPVGRHRHLVDADQHRGHHHLGERSGQLLTELVLEASPGRVGT